MPSVIAHEVSYGAGGAQLLSGVSLEARSGELTAVIGPAGAGKTSLLHVLAGLERPRTGSVVVGDTPLAGLGEVELTRLRRDRIGLLLPTASLLPTVAASENVALPLLISQRPPRPDAVDALLARVGLADRGAARTRDLTAAERQRVALARALAAGPSVLLADEPAGELDAGEGRELLALLRDVAHERGIAVVLFTRDAAAADAVSDRIVALEAGRQVPAAACLAA
jgi:putative ABC transport system ATP-binding protein